MRIRTILLLGCLVNFALIGGIILQSRKSPTAPAPQTSEARTADATQSQGSNPVAVKVLPPAPNTKNAWPPFRWAEIESDDYLQLATNLLAIGCPPKTVRDIVLGRARDDYAELLWGLQKQEQPQFWDRLARSDSPVVTSLSETLESRITEISAERDAVLKGLENALPAPTADAPQPTGRWSHLPPELRARVLAIEAEHDAAARKVDEQLEDIADRDERRKRRRELLKQYREERDQRIRAVAGDAAMEEHRLRSSAHADWLRSLPGVRISPGEMRSLVAARMQVDDRIRIPPAGEVGMEDLRAQRLAEREAGRAAAVTEVLGPERTREVERAGDEAYQTMRKVAWRHGLPMDVANRAYEVKRAAIEQAAQLAAATAQDPERRARGAAALLRTVRQELADIYGRQAFPTLEKYAMDWFDELFAGDESANSAPTVGREEP